MRAAKKYDALIIGSGASGGMAAKELTERGFEVLVLEAGPPVNPVRDFTSHACISIDVSRVRPSRLEATRAVDAGHELSDRHDVVVAC